MSERSTGDAAAGANDAAVPGGKGTQAAAEGLPPADANALLRWRLVLGSGAEEVSPYLSLGGRGLNPDFEPQRLDEIDEALEFVYGDRRSLPSAGYIPKWLGLIREFFSKDVVAFVQKDAIERKGLTQLLFEPETLPFLEKNVDLVATLLSARGLVPDRAKDMARQIVREVVDELRRTLESEVRTAILGAVRRNTDSPLKVARNIDWKRTISRNLKGWDATRRVIVPERFYFWANQRRRHEWSVVILVDQSGSMAVSAVYSAIMAAIFASLDVLKTHLAFFNDREIVDMTPVLSDPVEVLFTGQLGGAEDLNRAVAYAEENFISNPEKTILLLISDLFDTRGDTDQLKLRMRRLVESKVKAMALLKLSDQGQPSYHRELARELTEVGVHCFGCTPKLLVGVMERVMRNQDVASYLAQIATT